MTPRWDWWTNEMEQPADVIVAIQAAFYRFTPQSPYAKQWCDEHIDHDMLYPGEGLMVSVDVGRALVHTMAEAGLTLDRQ